MPTMHSRSPHQIEFLECATAELQVVVPFTLMIVFALLYLTFRRFDEAAPIGNNRVGVRTARLQRPSSESQRRPTVP